MSALKDKSTYKASHILLEDVPESIKTLYSHAHDLSSKMIDVLLAMYQQPYLYRESSISDEVSISAEDIEIKLEQYFGKTSPEQRILLKTLVDGTLGRIKSFANSENAVAMLFAEETALNVSKTKEYQLLKEAIKQESSFNKFKEDLIAEECNFEVFTEEEWENFLKNKDLKGFSEQFLQKGSSPAKSAAIQLREMGILPVKLGIDYDRNLFRAVMCTVSGRIKQWTTQCDNCVERKEENRIYFENKKKSVKLYSLFEKFADKLKEMQTEISQQEEIFNSGITKKLVIGIANGRGFQFPLAQQLLETEEFKDLEKDFFELGMTYLAGEKYLRTKNAATFCFFSEQFSPFFLRFGLTGRGYPFSMAASDNRFLFTIKKDKSQIGLKGIPSRYFYQPRVIEAKDGFNIEFTRLGNGNPKINSTIKELGLFKKNGKFYFSLSFEVKSQEVEKNVFNARKFFSSALNTKQDLPEGDVVIMGVDLGLRPIFAYATAKLNCKDGKISCPVASMDDVAFTNTGFRGNICNATLYSKLNKLAKVCYYGPKFLNVTKSIRDGKQISPVLQNLFTSIFVPEFGCDVIDDEPQQFRALQNKIKQIVTEYRQLSAEFSRRDMPAFRGKKWENVSAEYFAMLKLLQNIRSLLKSWGCYHLKSGESGKKIDLSSYDRHYQNLRLDTLRKMTSYIVKTAIEQKANIVVFEKLEIVDFDDEIKSRKSNSLRSIWSPNQLLSKLKTELEHNGILFTEVDPRHTSQLSSVTNEFGKRGNAFSKDFLYYSQKEDIVRIQSDVNASMNLVRRFLTRYASLSQLRGYQFGENFLLTEGGKHQQSFVNSVCGSNFGMLVPMINNSPTAGFVIQAISSSKYSKLIKEFEKKQTFKFYRHENLWFDKTTHSGKIKQIENQVSSLGDSRIVEIET